MKLKLIILFSVLIFLLIFAFVLWQVHVNEKAIDYKKPLSSEQKSVPQANPDKSYSAYIFAVGDSFTTGVGIKSDVIQNNLLVKVTKIKVWPSILETSTGKNVVNSGVNGWGAIQELNVINNSISELKPKIVLVGFYYDDFLNDYLYKNYVVKKLNIPGLQGYYKGFLKENISYNNFMWLKDASSKPIHIVKNDAEGWLNYDSQNMNTTFYINDAVNFSWPIYNGGKQLTENALLDAKKISEDIGAKFVLIIFPTKEDVYYNYFEPFVDYNKSAFELPRMEILDFCRKNEIKCIDVYPEFVKYANDGKELYFNNDAHPNELGHKVIADVVFQELIKIIPINPN